MRAALAAVALFLAAASADKPPRPEKFIGLVKIEYPGIAVMSSTETIFEGKPTPWHDIPDDTELVRIDIDVERMVVKRIEYRKRKDI